MNGKENAPGQGRKVMKIITALLLAISVVVIYRTHRAIPFMMDDLWYATMLENDTPISSFSDIIKSQIWHYWNWGGRSMTHGILQLTLLAGKQAADLLNVLFTLLLAGMVCLVAEHRRLSAFFAAQGMLLGLNANWKMSMFWQAGAANYLYITVVLLSFAYCYLRELPDEGCFLPRRVGSTDSTPKCGMRGTYNSVEDQEERICQPGESAIGSGGGRGQSKRLHQLPGAALWMVPLGILAGWSNENMGPAMWVLSLIAIVMSCREKRKIKLWMISGSLSCLAGSVFCIIAPGNFVRSGQIEEEQYGMLWKLFLRSYGECKAALEYLFPTLLVLGGIWVVCRCVLKLRIGRRNTVLLFCALLSWGAMFLSPHYPDRATFGTMTLCICVIVSLANKIVRQRKDLAWVLWGGAVLIWLRGMYFCGEYLAVVWGWIK